MQHFYLIIMLTIQGVPVNNAYEFNSHEDCRQAIVDIREGFGGIKKSPPVFCSPNAEPFNPGRKTPVGKTVILETPTRGDM